MSPLYTLVNLDWSDAAFANAPVVRPYARGKAAPGTYAPVLIQAGHGCPLFSNWPGVGYSPAAFKMKAYIDDQGTAYHRDTRAGRVFVCPGKRAHNQSL